MPKYLNGPLIEVNTNNMKGLIGKTVRYLSDYDIDRSGRGFYFPRVKTVMDVKNRQIIFNDWDSIRFSQIVEIELYNS